MHIKTGLLILLLPFLTACVTVGGEPPTRNEKASAINVEMGYGYMVFCTITPFISYHMLKVPVLCQGRLSRHPARCENHSCRIFLRESFLLNLNSAF